MIDYKELLKYTSNLNVLFIEDDEIILENTTDILEDYFKSIDTALNGEEAIKKYLTYLEENNKTYDLVITDLSMPKMDGETLINNILKISPNQEIIVISAYNSIEIIERLKEKNITNYLFKPLEFNKLLEILYETCKKINKI